jgi:hypothetical protein
MVVAADFQEVYFCHSITAYQAGFCCSVTWSQNTCSVVVLNNYRIHSISMPITQKSILWWMFAAYVYGLYSDGVSSSKYKTLNVGMIGE